jgi:hypothetical protein
MDDFGVGEDDVDVMDYDDEDERDRLQGDDYDSSEDE